MTRVAVFGASGFVGNAFVERLLADGDVEVRPLIHSSGNAARLARLGIPLTSVNLLEPASIARAIDGCSHVVNCSRGPAAVMTTGLRNLLRACHRNKVSRFVHVSSVAAYGEQLRDVELTEDAVAAPAPRTYGAMKLRQDEDVARAAREGLGAVIVCPPNIAGPNSAFLNEIVQALAGGAFALAGDGSQPCELVDVANLAHALRLALDAPAADGRRIFITDEEPVAWRALAERLARFADVDPPLPSVPLDEVRRLTAGDAAPRPSLGGFFRRLAGSEVRSALRKDPLYERIERLGKAGVGRLPWLERRLRARLQDAVRVKEMPRGPRWNVRLLRQQLRGVRYSRARAREVLGYTPVVSFDRSLAAYERWHRACRGWGEEEWTLLRELSV